MFGGLDFFLANVCDVPIQLPASHSASVVLGSAMLGKAAYVTTQDERYKSNQVIDNQVKAEKMSYEMKDKLWEIMVRF